MKQEDKNVLFKDLCSRLPYNTMVNWKDAKVILTPVMLPVYAESCKPYLRLLSSMTEEENHELERLINEKLNGNTDQEDDEWTPWVLYATTGIKNSIGGERFYFDEMSFIYDWLNAHHFDYRNLIQMGLAIAVTKENNPYKD